MIEIFHIFGIVFACVAVPMAIKAVIVYALDVFRR